MIDHIWFYSSLPSIVAVVCLFLVVKLYQNQSGFPYILLFVNLTLINLFQAVGYVAFALSPVSAEYVADAYLIATYFFFTHLMVIALHLSPRAASPLLIKLLFIVPFILAGLHIGGWLVEGYRIEQNTLMHNDGPLAWLTNVVALLSCLATLFILVVNQRQAISDRILKSKNLLALLSLVPFLVVAFIVTLLSMTPHAVSITIIGPFITLYTALVFYYISKQCIVDLSIGFRFFYGRLKLAVRLLETGATKEELKNYYKAIDKQLITESLMYNNHEIQATADYLKINHTTLRNKIKDYGIGRPQGG